MAEERFVDRAGRAYGAARENRYVQRLIEDALSEKILYKQFHAGEIIVVDVEDDPESPGDRRLAFRAVEGFVPPSAIELAGVGDGSPESDTPTSD